MRPLSFSTIKGCLQPDNSHNWLNKINKVQYPETESMRLGKELHRQVQEHFLGKRIIEELSDFEYKFPIVEEKDFDERCRFFLKIDADFSVQGFVDGKNPSIKDILEMKFVREKLWGVSDFNNTYQKKLIALCMPEYKRLVGFTAVMPQQKPDSSFDFSIWKVNKPKTYPIEFTQQDRDEAMVWLKKAVQIIVEGNFDGGLVDGVCVNRFCTYGKFCMFK